MSDHDNVYKAPESNLEINSHPNSLAERKDRFLAAIIDSVIAIALAIPFMFIAGPFFGFTSFESQPGYTYLIPATIFGFVMFIIIHGYLLSKHGQTVGKKVLKIKIVSMDMDKVSLSKLLLFRYLPISLVTLIPILGNLLPLADALFIFRKDKRCIHDLIAGTQVVKA